MNIRTENLLKTCRLFEEAAEVNKKWRPLFHLSPKTGWMNDPNGLCFFDGKYHIFFQYSPFDTKPGLNYWGHYATEDFVSYEYLPPALCSDEQFDCHGVYSGSAIVKDNELHLFYTGNVKLMGDNYDYINSGREHNTIHAVSRDGVNFEKRGVLLRNRDYPNDVTCHVRDPKVYEYGGEYVMLLGARTREDKGIVLIYRSADLDKWEYSGRITADYSLGFMWECPDLISINNRLFLSFSPQGVESSGILYNNIYQSGYAPIIGDFPNDCKIGEFTELDRGFDFYAPQSFVDGGGRRILIGWGGLPDIDDLYRNPTDRYGWKHILTLPREITERDGKLYQNPVKELEGLRKNKREYSFKGKLCAEADGIFEAEIQLDSLSHFSIEICGSMRLYFAEGIVTLELGENGYGRTKRSVKADKLTDLHIFCDTSAVEIYINGGAEVFTTRYYPEKESYGLKINGADGQAVIYKLDGFKERK
ncbi:MAG: glycoside hydrolase family 32 protein [Ruminiclostridium sp.]